VTTPWYGGVLYAFDTETTGPDPQTARIVTAALIRLGSKRPHVRTTWLVDPGVPIPAEATAIHGITTERAQADGKPPTLVLPDIAALLTVVWDSGAPVIGHNVRYDLTVLDRDLRRHGLDPLDVSGPVIDSLVLDKHVDPYRKGRRTLARCAEVYGIDPGDAHEAASDALAAARVAWTIAQRYPEVGAMTGQDLHFAQVGWAAEQAASLQEYFRRTDPAAVVDGGWPVQAEPVSAP